MSSVTNSSKQTGTPQSAEVVVVGAGPSGLMTAAELAAAGVAVTVLEKRGEPALSRAGVLQPRVMEIFAMRGLADRVLRRAREVNGERFETAKGIWAGLPGINYELLDSDFPYIVILPQIEVERLLAERCVALGVRLIRGAEVVAVTQDGFGVDVQYRQDGALTTLRAGYAVGADGSRSVVRSAVGIDWAGHAARNLAVNVDAEIPFPFPDPAIVVNTERGWGLSYPLNENLTRLAVIDAQTMLDVGRDVRITLESALESLRRIFGDDFGISEARVSQFHDAMFRAGSMRRDRVFLVGESVRVHYPASGVGMNFCLQDAFNLAWKIAASLQGWGPENVLDTYEQERAPEVDALLDSVRTQTGIQFSFTEESVALKSFLTTVLLRLPQVQKTIAEQLSGLSAHYGDGASLVGARVANVLLQNGGQLYDAVTPEGYLLVGGPRSSISAFKTSGRLHVLTTRDEPEGPLGQLLLVRPDGHVAAAGDAEAISLALKEARLR